MSETGTATQGTETAEEASALRGQLGELGGENKLLRKQLAFTTAIPGIDPTSKPVQAMLEQFDGEMTREAILKEAAEWNITLPEPAGTTTTGEVPTPVATTTAISDEERQAQAAAAAATQVGTATGATPDAVHPSERGLERFNEAMRAGRTREEAAGEFIDEVIGAAANGDQRVIVPGGRIGGPKD